MTAIDPELSALLDSVWGGNDDAARVMADFIIDRCTEDNPLVGYAAYNDVPDEGVNLVVRTRGGEYLLQFAEIDLGYAATEKFTAEKLVDKLPEWLDQQFSFVSYILSK